MNTDLYIYMHVSFLKEVYEKKGIDISLSQKMYSREILQQLWYADRLQSLKITDKIKMDHLNDRPFTLGHL